jgi:predicted DNA-binding transcriptional regulator AlpA
MSDTPQFFRMGDLASTKNKAGMIPVTASTIRRWIAEGKFPAPRQLSPGVTVWLAHDVRQWIVSNSAPME